MKNYHYLVITVFLLLINLLFNLGLTDVRFNDFDLTLAQINEEEDPNRSLIILGRFQIIKDRLLKGSEIGEDFSREARLQILSGYEESITPPLVLPQEPWYIWPVRASVNGVRFLLGKTYLGEPSPQEKLLLDDLQRAFLWERARRYDHATEIYSYVLTHPIPDSWRMAVLLHLGFSHTMLHEFSLARSNLLLLIRDYPDSPGAIIARTLLGYLDDFEAEWNRVMEEEDDLLERGRSLFFVMDYRRSQHTLEKFLFENPRDPRIPEALYFLGRSKEEQGLIDPAILDYEGTISQGPGQSWERLAWIRLYLLGQFYLEDAPLAQKSKDALVRLDQVQLLEQLRPSVILLQGQEETSPGVNFHRQQRSQGIAGESGLDILARAREEVELLAILVDQERDLEQGITENIQSTDSVDRDQKTPGSESAALSGPRLSLSSPMPSQRVLLSPPVLPTFPRGLKEDLAKSVDALQLLLENKWWPGPQDFLRLQEVKKAIDSDQLAPGIKGELVSMVGAMDQRILEKQSIEATIANLKNQLHLYESAYQEFMESKPDVRTPMTVSFVLGAGFLAGTGAAFLLEPNLGSELTNTIGLATGIMSGLSLGLGGSLLLIEMDQGPDKPLLDQVSQELEELEKEYQARRVSDEGL